MSGCVKHYLFLLGTSIYEEYNAIRNHYRNCRVIKFYKKIEASMSVTISQYTVHFKFLLVFQFVTWNLKYLCKT